MLSRTEKEKRVIELYQQGKTIREIAQDVHMSFSDIGSVIKKLTGLDDAKKPRKYISNNSSTRLGKLRRD